MQETIFKIAGTADTIVIGILGIMSVVSLGVIIERYMRLSKVHKKSLQIRYFLKQKFAEKADLNFIEEIAKETDSVEGRGVEYALDYMQKNGVGGLEQAFTSFQLTEKPELEKSVSILATIGSNAPFVGLLGTVLGIMKAFADLANASQADQNTVMAGISVALVATACGLFVAIPSVMAFNYFQKKVNSVLENLETCKDLCLAYGTAKKGK